MNCTIRLILYLCVFSSHSPQPPPSCGGHKHADVGPYRWCKTSYRFCSSWRCKWGLDGRPWRGGAHQSPHSRWLSGYHCLVGSEKRWTSQCRCCVNKICFILTCTVVKKTRTNQSMCLWIYIYIFSFYPQWVVCCVRWGASWQYQHVWSVLPGPRWGQRGGASVYDLGSATPGVEKTDEGIHFSTMCLFICRANNAISCGKSS